MALYVIGDTHLSEAVNKPMDIFGGAWQDYRAKLLRALGRPWSRKKICWWWQAICPGV